MIAEGDGIFYGLPSSLSKEWHKIVSGYKMLPDEVR
jgi:hypothetical protein